MDDRTTGYHLFLEPEGVLQEELAEHIRLLAGEYRGPIFQPHITLVGPFEGNTEEIIRTATELAHECEILPLTFGELGGEDTYFRAFYLRIEDSPALASLRVKALDAFMMPDQAYTPHLSLYYGYPTEEQRSAMTASSTHVVGTSFSIQALSVYRTEGRADEWESIARIPFGRMLD